MKTFNIEVDEIIWDYLKSHAEPFSDSPNTVLHRLLFGAAKPTICDSEKGGFPDKPGQPSYNKSQPKALSQIFEIVYEVAKLGRSRPEATNIVAARNNTRPQTILDKYCRQLGKRAYEFDQLLQEVGMPALRSLLKNKFEKHQEQIDSFFESLPIGACSVGNGNVARNEKHPAPNVGRTSASRKQRDTELEEMLKMSFGNLLKPKWDAFTLEGSSLLVFNKRRVLCKYSSYNDEQGKWFWGVPKKYWTTWNVSDYLSLIFENDDKSGYSFLLFNADEARHLFNNCSESDGEKKVSMRIYTDDNKPHLQEWRNFDVGGRMRKLNADWN